MTIIGATVRIYIFWFPTLAINLLNLKNKARAKRIGDEQKINLKH